MKRYLSLSILLILALASCGKGPEKCRTDKALLEDSFNDTACGWDEYDESGAAAGYSTSEYFITVKQPDTSAVAVPGGSYNNVMMQADARLVSGSENNNYGLMCRYQDMNHFYAFIISSDGYYAIVKVMDGATYTILSGDGTHLMPSEAIDTDFGKPNEIKALCNYEELTLTINGQQMASVSDSDLKSGDIGFIASTYDEAPLEIRFDNLVVFDPAVIGLDAE